MPAPRPSNTLLTKIEQNIRQKVLVYGDRLPSERVLQDRFGCTRITVREALLRLAAKGLIYRQPRRGWFVSPPRFICNPTHRIRFFPDAQAQGFQPATEVVYCREEQATQQVQDILQHTNIQNICRLRRLNERPVLIENLHLVSAYFPNLASHKLRESVTDLLRDQYNTEITHEEARIRSTALQDWHAEQLQVAPGTPAIQILRTRYNTKGQAVEFDIEYWLHDAIELHVQA